MDAPALGRLLGAGKEAEVFAFGGGALKLYRAAAAKRSAFREAANAAVAESLGLPVPKIHGLRRFGDRWGILMSLAEAKPNLRSVYLTEMGLLQFRVHGHPGTHFASLKARLAANIRQANGLDGATRNRLLAKLQALPEGERLCHGDFHPFNILGPPSRPTLIDWLDASSGAPAADVCRSYILIGHSEPEIASTYVEAYIEVSGETRANIFEWLPIVAAARLAEDVPKEAARLREMAVDL
jgi:aminoglycoside phosphotransferase (APT) family kinase protein